MRPLRIVGVILALSVLINLSACSKRTLLDVEVVTPPKELLADCQVPAESAELFRFLKDGNTDDAAVEYARYVLDVRDSFQMCNGRLKAAREYCDNMKKNLEGSLDER